MPEVKVGDTVLVRGPVTYHKELKGSVTELRDDGSANVEIDWGDNVLVLHGIERNDDLAAQLSFAAYRPEPTEEAPPAEAAPAEAPAEQPAQ